MASIAVGVVLSGCYSTDFVPFTLPPEVGWVAVLPNEGSSGALRPLSSEGAAWLIRSST